MAQAAEDILKKYLWFNTVPISATALASNVATIFTPVPHEFRLGQSVVISSAGAVFNGTKTITGTSIYSFTYAKTASDQLTHVVRPYGLITGEFHATDYATVPAIREAAATIASTIWNSRQAPGATTVTIDGYISNPFALGNTLLAKVRGLIAPYQNPASMIG